MKKFSRATILEVLERAKLVFLVDSDAVYFVKFNFHGRPVTAYFDPIPNDFGWTVSSFKVFYSRCVMTYKLGVDYERSVAYICD